MGPKRDIVGQWAQAVKRRDMKFAATFHHAFAWNFYEPAYRYDAADEQYADLYCQPHKPNTPPTKVFSNRPNVHHRGGTAAEQCGENKFLLAYAGSRIGQQAPHGQVVTRAPSSGDRRSVKW
jgi:alpha-L-fucosidase